LQLGCEVDGFEETCKVKVNVVGQAICQDVNHFLRLQLVQGMICANLLLGEARFGSFAVEEVFVPISALQIWKLPVELLFGDSERGLRVSLRGRGR